MHITRSGRPLPYRREQLFDLAADIESYPQFLRGWKAARIVGRDADRLRVEQMLGIGALHLKFETTATLLRPQRIDVTSRDPMFRQFALCFLVADADGGHSRLGLTAHIEMRSALQQIVLGAALAASVQDIVDAFETRAHRLYARS
jgi:coenzyme Q-binding protein COQ10